MSNKNYTHIHSHGTSSAFTPRYIAKAGSVGTADGVSTGSPFTVIDVTVDVGALTVTPSYISLGDALPVGSVITQASMNGHDSVLLGTIATYQVGFALTSGTAVVDALPAPLAGAAIASAPPAAVGTTINGGVLTLLNTTVIAANRFPVLEVISGGTSDTVGNITVKIVYVSP
jgi:hypothetical protein